MAPKRHKPYTISKITATAISPCPFLNNVLEPSTVTGTPDVDSDQAERV